MSNTFINPTIVAKEALRQLENNCVMGNLVFRGYEEEYKTLHRGWKQGASVTVKTPVYFRTKTARAIDRVDLLEQSTTFTVNYWRQVSWIVNAEEMSLNIDKFSKRFIKPAMQALANDIDTILLGLYKGIPQQVGTPGTTPDNLYTYLEADALMTEMATPMAERSCVINPRAHAKLVDHLKGLFHQNIVGSAVQKAQFGSIAGFDMFKSQNVATHTNGTAMSGLTIQKDGNSTNEDTTLAIKSGGTNQTFCQGDIFTIAAVNAVNPISGISTGQSRQFVVDAAAIMDGAGEVAALQTTPGTAPYKIRSSTSNETYLPYQNLDTLPQHNAVITPVGTTGQVYPVNMAFHRDALGLVMVPIEIPESFTWKAVESANGYTISVVRYPDGDTLSETIRMDALFGVKVLNPFMACRIAG